MTTLTQDVKKLDKLKDEASRLDAEAKVAKEAAKEFERKVYERMQAEGSEGTRAVGKNFVPSSTPYAVVQDREEFTAWALEHDSGLLEPKERKEPLNQLVRDCLNSGQELPPGVGFYVREYVSRRVA